MKKDGTLLEIKVVFKQSKDDGKTLNVSADISYCDKNYKNNGSYFLVAIAKAIQEANAKIEVTNNG